MRSSLFLSFLAVVLLAGCAGGPPALHPPVPAEVRAKGVSVVHSTALDETSHIIVHLDEAHEVVYAQSFGNSVAVGVMLGPLGVLANVAATKAVTENDLAKLKGKIPVSASAVFSLAADETKLQLAEQRTDGGVKLSPYLYLVKLSDGKVLLAAALLVEVPNPGGAATQARYMYQLPLRYSVDELAAASPAMLDNIAKQLQTGYVEMIRFYQNDKPATMARERLVKYRSDFLSPRFDFEAPGKVVAQKADRIWIRHSFGVAAVLRPNITVVGPWE